ncbi:MAG: Ldh family oxidoreductase [Candidatus Latescibacterota bacterium]|jgi:LDH2 family malate/lactate/ureidoglycolate dehydrogenase
MNLPPTDSIRVPAASLSELSTSLFVSAGLSRLDAERITSLLIDCDLRGVLSHGTLQISGYVSHFLGGQLNPAPCLRVSGEDSATALVDGDGGLGHLAAYRATELAIARARASGVGTAATRNHGHYGAAGSYTRMAAGHGCVGFSVSGHTMGSFRLDRPTWNPFGNPPMSFAFPCGDEAPLVLDMGTSFFEPEHFPALFGQAPAAFFKSIGLVAVANLLSGVMTGMMLPQFQPGNRQYAAAGYGAFVAAVDIGRFVPLKAFVAEVDRTMREVHALPPLPGYARYDLPGGLEREREHDWARDGIPLGREHRKGLERIAAELGIPVPWQCGASVASQK